MSEIVVKGLKQVPLEQQKLEIVERKGLGNLLSGELKAASDVEDARWIEMENIGRYAITKELRTLLSKK